MNVIFWDVSSCGSCKNQHFRGTCCLHLQGDCDTSQKTTFLIVTTVKTSNLTTLYIVHVSKYYYMNYKFFKYNIVLNFKICCVTLAKVRSFCHSVTILYLNGMVHIFGCICYVN
jgi:hypothetical protein